MPGKSIPGTSIPDKFHEISWAFKQRVTIVYFWPKAALFMIDDLLQLRIIRIYSETSDAKSYFLEPVDDLPVQYRADQFLTLLLVHNGHEVRRSYSLSSAESETLRLTIKRIQNGEISRYLLDTLRVGDVLTSLHPAGRFVLDECLSGDLVMLGAGSGITPLFRHNQADLADRAASASNTVAQ